jgi:uncharacterized membrane protein YdjX (TVP38/TMEM64 family)
MRIRNHKRGLIVVVILAGISLLWILFVPDWPSFGSHLADLETRLSRWGVVAYLAFVAAFVLLALFPLPTTFWVLLGGALFGPLIGSALSLLAATLAAVIAFTLARTWLQPWLEPRLGPRGARLCEDAAAEGWRIIALTRLVPVFPFVATNYALGLVRVPLPIFALTTMVALIPSLLAYSWLGHATGELARGADSGVQLGLAAVAVLALVLLLPRLVRRIWLGQRALRVDSPVISDPGEKDSDAQREKEQGGEGAQRP